MTMRFQLKVFRLVFLFVLLIMATDMTFGYPCYSDTKESYNTDRGYCSNDPVLKNDHKDFYINRYTPKF